LAIVASSLKQGTRTAIRCLRPGNSSAPGAAISSFDINPSLPQPLEGGADSGRQQPPFKRRFQSLGPCQSIGRPSSCRQCEFALVAPALRKIADISGTQRNLDTLALQDVPDDGQFVVGRGGKQMMFEMVIAAERTDDEPLEKTGIRTTR